MSEPRGPGVSPASTSSWDHSSHDEFYTYYAEESASDEALGRFRRIRDHILRMMGHPDRQLDVADIGCGAGTQSMVWAEQGHHVRALDVNGPLVALRRGVTRSSFAWARLHRHLGAMNR
jgi:2-polyprenyl-3-methyl-5-hydroxy-6-metoxy-1,4-benzoquinol methylase